MARPGQRQQGARRTAPRKQQSVRQRGDVFSVLSRTVREVEAAARRGRDARRAREVPGRRPAAARRARPRAGGGRKRQPAGRAAQAPRRHRGHPRRDRRPGRRAARPAGRGLRRLRRRPVAQARGGRDLRAEPAREQTAPAKTASAPGGPPTRVVPQSVISRQLANPFLAPDFSAVPQRTSRPRRLAGWELLGPLLTSFEQASGGAPACMTLPDADRAIHPGRPGADAASGGGGGRGGRRSPDLPARR